MTFTNVPTAPGVTILYAEDDYFLWPSMAGEKYPPVLASPGTLSTDAFYTGYKGYPGIRMMRTGVGQPTASWPYVPYAKPTDPTHNTVTITGKVAYVSNSGSNDEAEASLDVYGNLTNATATPSIADWSTYVSSLAIAIGTTNGPVPALWLVDGNSASAAITIAMDTLYPFTLTIPSDASAACTLTANSTTVTKTRVQVPAVFHPKITTSTRNNNPTVWSTLKVAYS